MHIFKIRIKMSFEFKIEEKKDYVIIYLKGNLVQQNQALDLIDEFNALLAQNYSIFRIHLENLTTNDSGVALFINILTKARVAGGDVVFLNAKREMLDLIDNLKLNRVIKPVIAEMSM